MAVYGFKTYKLKNLKELPELYRKHGQYFLWGKMNDYNFTVIGEESISPMFFRNLICSQLLNASNIDWKAMEADADLSKISEKMVEKLKEDWKL